MKKKLLATVASVLVLALMIPALSVAAQGTCVNGNCGNCPCIILTGIGHSFTYLYDDNDELILDSKGAKIGGEMIFFGDTDELINDAIKTLVLPLILTLLTQRDCGFTQKAYEFARRAFRFQSNDANGENNYNLKVERFYCPIGEIPEGERHGLDWIYMMIPVQSLTDVIGEDHVYLFTFNLVGNPMDSAAELDDYIETVKRQTGHDKVNLLNVSLGGTIFTAYIDSFGWEDINEVVNVVACLDGTDMAADIFARDFILDDRFIHHEWFPELLGSLIGDESLGYLVNIMIRILPRNVFEGFLTRLVDAMLGTVVLNCPQLWACVPKERYPALAERYLSGEEHAVLRAKTDRFYQAQKDLAANMRAMVADGIEINNIVGANLEIGEGEMNYCPAFRIMKSSRGLNSDGIIPFYSTSVGGTGADRFETLPDGYTQKKTYAADPSYSYISPDRTVDVSTGVLPDNTWVFLGQHHEVGRNGVVLNLAKQLLTSDTLKDVHSDPVNYPQFNGTAYTYGLQRTYYRVRNTLAAGGYDGTDADIPALRAALEQAESVLTSTIADSALNDRADAAEDAIFDAIDPDREPSPAKEPDVKAKIQLFLFKNISRVLLYIFGGNGYSDGIRLPL